MRTIQFLEEYAKHTALNLGQALQGIRYLYSHPSVDAKANRGSAKHVAMSFALRSKRIANDLFFATIPPHWHHTPDELRGMTQVPISHWFQYGYYPWRFTNTGEPKDSLADLDKRWDPRCADDG